MSNKNGVATKPLKGYSSQEINSKIIEAIEAYYDPSSFATDGKHLTEGDKQACLEYLKLNSQMLAAIPEDLLLCQRACQAFQQNELLAEILKFAITESTFEDGIINEKAKKCLAILKKLNDGLQPAQTEANAVVHKPKAFEFQGIDDAETINKIISKG